MPKPDRDALLDEAIAALSTILVDSPGLVRVRLELARAFFLKGEDGLARQHFELVLAGEDLPLGVTENIRRFLAEIRAGRRWDMQFGMALAPDSNLGSTSDVRIIYIFGLPFERDEESLKKSGVGVSVWAGGEYQHPLGERLRLRAGFDISRKEYEGRDFDQFSVSGHLGPRWLLTGATEVSLLASVSQRWVGTAPEHRDAGARIEVGHRLTPRLTANGRASWHRREYRTRVTLNGPVLDVSLGGSWVITPTVRAEASVGYRRVRPESERHRNASRRASVSVLGDAAGGIHRGRRRRAAVDGLRGQLGLLHARGRAPRGPDPHPAGFGPTPLLRGLWIQPGAGSGEGGAEDQRAALRLPEDQGRVALRAPVLTRLYRGWRKSIQLVLPRIGWTHGCAGLETTKAHWMYLSCVPARIALALAGGLLAGPRGRPRRATCGATINHSR